MKGLSPYWWSDEQRARHARQRGEWADDIADDPGENPPQQRFCLAPASEPCPDCGECPEDDPDGYTSPEDGRCWNCDAELDQ